GGRYDGLVEQLGGPPTPAAGWAAGIERIALALEAEPEPRAGDAFIVAGDAARERALALATELRRAGFSVDLDLAGRAAKGQMKQADRAGARYAVFLEDDGSLQLRDMASGEQRAVEESQLASEIGASRD
ncbi:MAG: His/Gly/Thr/Pro-type tRNA ligase C-terminal domain-containing protein, partial [Solirubrobacterales bacterium]